MSVLPSTVGSLFDAAARLLLTSEDALATTTGGTPDRTFVAPSDPPFDCCPFLAVVVNGLAEDTTAVGPGGVAAGHRATTGSIILASYTVLAVRCAPPWDGQTPPTPAQIEASAEQVLQDGWALWNELRRAIRCGEIWGVCEEVYLDAGISIPEQGGCVGWRFNVRARIQGIPSDCGDVIDETPFADGVLGPPTWEQPTLTYPGLTPPSASGGEVCGVAGNTSAPMLLTGVESETVGVVAGSDFSTASAFGAGVTLFLVLAGETGWYEVFVAFTGVNFVSQAWRVSDGGNVYDDVYTETIIPAIPSGAAFAIEVEGTTLRLVQNDDGDADAMVEVVSGLVVPLAGALTPGFMVQSDVCVSEFLS